MGIFDLFKKKEVSEQVSVETPISTSGETSGEVHTSFVSLTKGQKIDLTKSYPKLSELMIGLGWDVAKGHSVDCDASAIMIDNNNKVYETVSFRKLSSSCRSIRHMGDNLTGEGDGDDEQIRIDLKKVPNHIKRIVFVVNIYSCINRHQHFGMVNNAFIRLVNISTNKELAKYNLSKDSNNMTALILGEVVKNNDSWEFTAKGEFTKDTCISDLEVRYNQ